MHDASEAFICDIPRPLKQLLPNYVAFEQRLEAVIAKQFGTQFPFPPEIKEIDNRLLVTERVLLVSNSLDWGLAFEPYPDLVENFELWTIEESFTNFLHRYWSVV